jgi:cysteinyl-tRNA synthetase
LGNFISLDELFSGNHPLLSQAYSPMVVRLFILQAQYRSTIDFSDEALQASKKNYLKFINVLRLIKKMQYSHFDAEKHNASLEEEIYSDFRKIFEALDDDLNTALAITHLLAVTKKINQLQSNPTQLASIKAETFDYLKKNFLEVFEEILGIKEEKPQIFEPLLNSLLKAYQEAKQLKQYDKVDAIRADLKELGISLKDTKQGIDWAYSED